MHEGVKIGNKWFHKSVTHVCDNALNILKSGQDKVLGEWLFFQDLIAQIHVN